MAEIETRETALALPASPTFAAYTDVLTRLAYPLALAGALSIWLLAIRAPLWLDETLSFWQISGGFSNIWERSSQMPSSIGYLYTLWAAKSILGSSELALKLPSLFALLGAVYFLFRSAKELFGQEAALLACVFLALEGNVAFAATDARPYAFALLMTTVAIFAYVRWMSGHEMHQAMAFGAAAAGILYYHYLFGSILPAFAIYYLIARGRFLRSDLRQLAVVVGTFGILVIPLVVRVVSLYNTRSSHTVEQSQHPVLQVFNTLAPKQMLIGLLLAAFLAALVKRIRVPDHATFPQALLPLLLATVPAAVLFGLSTATPLRLVIPRYFSVVAPGSALMWGFLATFVDSRWLRQVFCVGLVAVTLWEMVHSPFVGRHELSFKRAHELVNTELAKEQGPVLVCSAFIESNYVRMPDSSSDDPLFSQTYYYPINASVTLLPMILNDEAVRVSTEHILAATLRGQRILAVAGPPSYATIEWLANYTRGTFTARVLGRFDEIAVVEFRPIAGTH